MFCKYARPRSTLLLGLCLTFTLPGVGWAKSSGALYINTQPAGVQIYLDGDTEPIDTTPALLTSLTTGTHNLKLSLSGYATLDVVVTVAPDKVNDLRYTLNRQFGNLYIETSPAGAEIRLVDEPAGVSPLELSHLLATEQKIHIELEGYKPWFKQIEVAPNKTTNIMVKLIPQPPAAENAQTYPNHQGQNSQLPKEKCSPECHDRQATNSKLKVESNPGNADVWLDGELTGRTPLNLRLFPGDYIVKLTKPGYASQQKRVQIVPKKEFSINFVLDYQYDIEDMIFIKGGEFIMGTNDAEADESPAHKVQLKSFYINKYEATNTRYRRFLSLTKYRRRPSYTHDPTLDDDRQPIVGTTWSDAYDYCKWAGKRLPSEAEWEKAARGTEGLIYPWGNEWRSDYSNNIETGLQKPVAGGNYPLGKSPYGVLDMAGNVWEWCNDYYDKNYYAQSPAQDPVGPEEGKLRVLRGGSWFDGSANLRTTNRRGENPQMRLSNIGFRCAKDADF